jgi:NAD-dependent dihydropyrimidine dehydrogenase PreA subunit
MKIVKDECIACGLCITSCPVRAISMQEENYALIDRDECVECFNCLRIECPTAAIKEEELEWPRNIRKDLSNPTGVDPKSGVSGRGTAEMKTNEVTGRIYENTVGICLELGRPGTGTRFYDVEKVCMALAKHGVYFEPLNPVTYLMVDETTGKLREDVLQEKVLSAIVEGLVSADKLTEVLKSCQQVANEVETVFSVGVSSIVGPNDEMYFTKALEELNLNTANNGKTNVGLGRPLAKEAI